MARSGRVAVGPFEVDDLTAGQVVNSAVELAQTGRLTRFYALHVGGLNHRSDADFVDEMNSAELVCADGGSVVSLAKLAGASRVERAPTTDVGWDLLRGLVSALGRAPRVALIGGEPGLATRAGEVLSNDDSADPVYTEHGFHTDWTAVLTQLRAAQPEVCIVGMGAPREMMWVRAHRDDLPPSLIMTCGGWFGFLTGEEARAPGTLRRSGLEWIARVGQSPARLGPRYAQGVVSTSVLALGIIRTRWRERKGPYRLPYGPGDLQSPSCGTDKRKRGT